MEINKENVFEMIFDGFQQKFIESFKALGEEKILVRILENQKASKEEFRTYFNCAWEFLENSKIAEQQAKVEELQKRVVELGKQVSGSLAVLIDYETGAYADIQALVDDLDQVLMERSNHRLVEGLNPYTTFEDEK